MVNVIQLDEHKIAQERIKVFWGDTELKGVIGLAFIVDLNKGCYDRMKNKEKKDVQS